MQFCEICSTFTTVTKYLKKNNEWEASTPGRQVPNLASLSAGRFSAGSFDGGQFFLVCARLALPGASWLARLAIKKVITGKKVGSTRNRTCG